MCFILQALGRSESRDLHGIDPGFCSEIMADDSQAGDTRLSDYNVIHERGRSTLTYIKMDYNTVVYMLLSNNFSRFV